MADSSTNNLNIDTQEHASTTGRPANEATMQPIPDNFQHLGEQDIPNTPPVLVDFEQNQHPLSTEADDHASSKAETFSAKRNWGQWYQALKSSFPTYLGVHLGFIVTTIYATLFVLHDFEYTSLPISRLWNSWHRWDTGDYLGIAQISYHSLKETAFFPLFPLFIRAFMLVFKDPFISGLIVSNLLGLGFIIVFYRLVIEEFDLGTAQRAILYISIFPTAFFLSASYSETTFLFFAVLTFFYLRKGNWWLAGLFGLLTSLSSAAGLLLVVPFCYEYLAQHGFSLKKFPLKNLRFNLLACVLIPLGTGLFMLYCYHKFHDPLSFLHAEAYWKRSFHAPWFGMTVTISEILQHPHLTFVTLRDLLDLIPDLFILGVIILMFVGPWRWPLKDWSYAIFAATSYVFFLLAPVYPSPYPLQSSSRYLLALFPAFIILARIGKNRGFHLHYLLISGALLFFMLTQFLTHHWIV